MPPLIGGIVGAVLLGLAVSGVSYGISILLAPKIDQPTVPDERLTARFQQQTVSVRDPVRSREMVYGKTRKGGTIVEHITTTGKSSEFNLVIAFAGHECEAIEEIYFGEDVAFSAAGVVQAKFVGKAEVTKFLGTSTQLADAGIQARVSRWTPNHRLRGICYIVLVLQFDRDIFPGLPNVSAVIKGKKVYDPRSGLTAWSDNAALCQADYLNDATYGLAIPYGIGSPLPSIDYIKISELITAANICDELVAIPPVGSPVVTQKRYTLNGIVDSAEEPESNMRRLLSASYGRAFPVGGEWYIRAGAFITPTLTLDENDLRGSLAVQPRIPRRELFNAVRGVFISAKNKYQPADFPPKTSTTFETQDNGERIWRDIELPFTDTETMAQRIAKIHLFANREQISVSYPSSLKAMQLHANDTVKITNARMGWSQKTFLVTDWTFVIYEDENGEPILGTTLQLRETSSAVYDSTASEQQLLDAAPDTLLASPSTVEFWATLIDGRGQFATSSVTSGFEAIKMASQFPSWIGTKIGLVYNPWTGNLNCDDQVLANLNNFDLFDQYVVTPVITARYESPEIAISFDDLARLTAPMQVEKGPGEVGSFEGLIEFDFRTDIGAYGGFNPLRVVSVTGKFFKFRLTFTTDLAGMILKAFTPAVSKRLVVNKRSSEIIPVAGKTFVFAQPYHNLPQVGANVQAAGDRSAVITALSTIQFTATVFNQAGSDVGGTIGWRSEGV